MKIRVKHRNDGHEACSFRLEGRTLSIEGELTISAMQDLPSAVWRQLRNLPSGRLVIDLGGVQQLDSGGVSALTLIREKLLRKGYEVEFRAADTAVAGKMEIFSTGAVQPEAKPVSGRGLERLGAGVRQVWTRDVLDFMYLASEIFYWSWIGLLTPGSRRKGEVVHQALQIGVLAVPIVTSLAFIIGLVLALQSAAQLRNFGANIYIVDLTVIAMMREMGPLITAILVAGRSGSSIAAEIATMRVTSELDALTTMGLNPVRFVIVPKIYGALITVPLLTILADVCGIIGGAAVAYTYLDIAPEVFMSRMPEVLLVRDLYVGLVKSLAFTGLIVFTGAFFGMRASRGAEGVGRMTTRAVVVAIALVIVADSLLGLIFY